MMESSIFNVLEIFCPSVRNKWISVTVTCRTRPECLRCLGELSFRYIGCQPAASARIYSPQPMCVGIVLQKPVLGNCYRLRVSLRASQVPRTHVICHKSSRQMTDKWLVICHKSCELWRVICLSFQRNNVTNWLVTNWLVTNWLVTNWLVTNWLVTNWLVTNWLVTNWLVTNDYVTSHLSQVNLSSHLSRTWQIDLWQIDWQVICHVICHKSSRQMTGKWRVICHKLATLDLWQMTCHLSY